MNILTNNLFRINIQSSHKRNTPAIAFKGQDSFERAITLKGDETEAKIYTTNIDYPAINQIREFCNHPALKDTPIRIMPDVHAGKTSVVGFSAPIINGKVIPNIIGGDIGCGVLCLKFDPNGKEIDFEKLDNVIRTYVSTKRNKIPSAKGILTDEFEDKINKLCKQKFKKSPEEILSSIGTLGGGNHFIEINKGDNGDYYLVIHTGSRKFGKEVNQYHQKIANLQNPYRNKDLSYLSGDEAKKYLENTKLAVKFSEYNRKIIANEILKQMGWEELDSFESIHNYISNDNIIRKGAICADKDKSVIIPLNMRDGSLLGSGKGNKDWNNTAPHGAGRQFKRSEAAERIKFDDYKKSMEGIYSSCITPSHIDESPMAYKDSVEIIENIEDTVDVKEIISPVFNYKD